MIAVTTVRPNPSTVRQWWVLTARVIAPTLRNGELLIAIAASAVFTVGFYLPLKQVMGVVVQGMSGYAQYLTPLIALQAISFAAISAALRSATDSVLGVNRRFRSMPIASLIPVAARMSGSLFRCVIALAIAILCGYVIGFRFYRTAEYTVGFCLLVLLIGFALSFVGDMIGVISNPEAAIHILILPQLILGLLSVGIQPVTEFPVWIQPFVRNQPTSQFVYAMRVLAGDTRDSAYSPAWPVIRPTLAWLCGVMVIAVTLYAFVLSRRRGGGKGRYRVSRLRTCAHRRSRDGAAMRPVGRSVARPGRGLWHDDHRPVTRTPSENSPRRLFLHTWVQTQRLLILWARDATTIIEALILPVALLLTMDLVLGHRISSITGHNGLYGSVPTAALVGAIFGSSAAGVRLMRERESGLLARFWVLPVHRASGLTSRLLAEVVRILVTNVAVLCTGLVLGFRFQQGIFPSVAWLFVPVTFGVAFATLVTTLAFYAADTVLAESAALHSALLFFFCTGFVPLAQYPHWIQPVVEHQPMSYAVEAMRGLSLGGPVLVPMLGTFLWSAGIAAACIVPMVAGYRKASMR
jgi:ABC-2 type transport system permease protein